MNEKLIHETLANHTERLADLQMNLAGLTALVISRLPNLSPQEKESLQSAVDLQMKDAETLKRAVEPLREALKKL